MKKITKALAAFAAAGAVAFTGVAPAVRTAPPRTTAFAVDDGNDDWLHAKGSRLYDMNGNEVWLTGANWFGFNCNEACPHYLWSADADDCLTEIADRGINILRFPISTELIVSWMNGTPNEVNSFSANADPAFKINADFCQEDGKTPVDSMQVFDIMMKKCKEHGIKAFIDIHSPHTDNSGHNYNLWYGKAGVTTKVWIDSLVWLADKYKNDDTLIAFDLKNEPHGKGQEGKDAAKWDGTTDENNWAYAATKCAEAILDVNPNALILVEGVEQSMSGAMEGDYWGMPDRRDNSPYIGAWWGGNFRGAREYPIKPKQGTSQIVYSPHDYGPSVYAQTWFDKDFTEQTLLDDYWYDTWAYINAEEIGPELIGEWGGHMEGDNLKWMKLLRDYMIKHHINHTFWCLNTNSGDTGGLWDSLGFTAATGTSIKWNEPKYELFEEALWQTASSGKYIGLDHQRALGKNGISLNEYYTKYAATEGSNLDGGKKGSGTPIEVSGTTPAQTTTSSATVSATTTSSVTTTSASTTSSVTTTAEMVRCEHCGKMIPKSEAVYGPLGFPVCRECYENGAYIGTVAPPPTVTTTSATTTVTTTTTTTTSKGYARMTIEKPPTKSEYLIGETLDLSGGVASASGQSAEGAMWDTFSQPLDSKCFTVDASGFDNTKAGTYTIYVYPTGYPEAKKSLTVIVKEGTSVSGTTPSQSSDTTGANSTEATMWGDANCDDQVNLADAVIIMQSISNPDKYGVGKPDGISKQGEANGDVDKSSKGLTNKDALAIQRFKLGLVDKLPI